MFSKYIENIEKSKRTRQRPPPTSRTASARAIALRAATNATLSVRYQACCVRQCGQATVVETGARNTYPQAHA